MGPVTAEAVHLEVRISRINDLGTDRVTRVRLPIMTLSAAGDIRRLFLQKEVIRCMWRVTDSTLPFTDRLVFGLRAILTGQSVGMTTAANIHH